MLCSPKEIAVCRIVFKEERALGELLARGLGRAGETFSVVSPRCSRTPSGVPGLGCVGPGGRGLPWNLRGCPCRWGGAESCLCPGGDGCPWPLAMLCRGPQWGSFCPGAALSEGSGQADGLGLGSLRHGGLGLPSGLHLVGAPGGRVHPDEGPQGSRALRPLDHLPPIGLGPGCSPGWAA